LTAKKIYSKSDIPELKQQVNKIMPEINITPTELKKIYEEMTNSKAAEHFGISPTTLIKLVKEAGIPEKGRGSKKPRIKLVK